MPSLNILFENMEVDGQPDYVFTSATRATAKTLTQAGHVAPKFWVLDIRT